jgi:hypothetical protein
MSLFNVFNVAGSAMSAQSMRLNTTASNLANADSATSASGEAYRAKQVVFEAVPVASGSTAVKVREVVEDPSPLKQVYDPKNPLADDKGFVNDAERERGRRDGQHAVGLALLPDQCRNHERGQDHAAQDPDHRPVILSKTTFPAPWLPLSTNTTQHHRSTT